MIKEFLIWLLVIIITILSATFLISIVHIIDSPKLEEHVLESSLTLAKEDVHENANSLETSVLDNHTDALMLLIASYRGNEPLIDKGMNNYRVYKEGLSPYEQLTIESDANEKVISYYRYWHGYTLFLRPLLMFFNYSEIRVINALVQIVIFIFLIALMVKRKLGWYIFPLISAYLLINPHAITMSLQNSTIWYITCISIIIYLIYKEKIKQHNLHYILFTVTRYDYKFYGFFNISNCYVGDAINYRIIS